MARPLNVLLAEDDDPLREVLLELLAQRGWQVYAAARGDEAVELAHRITPDLSILDFHLPGLTGLQVFQRISAEIRPAPAIMISGDASRDEALAALDAGFVDFLRKPLDLTSFRERLDAVALRLGVVQDDLGAATPQAQRSGAARGSSDLLPTRLQDLHLFELLTFSMGELAARGLPAEALAQLTQLREMLRGSIRFPEDDSRRPRLEVESPQDRSQRDRTQAPDSPGAHQDPHEHGPDGLDQFGGFRGRPFPEGFR